MVKALDYSVIDVANEIIKRAKEDKITLNLTKLQKLIYFVYGEFLLSYQIRLFKDDEPVKWIYGPVFTVLYDITKKNGVFEIINPIALEEISNKSDECNSKINDKDSFDKFLDGFLAEFDEGIEIVPKKYIKNLEKNLENILDSVWNENKNKTAKELSDDTHKNGYAWDRTDFFNSDLSDEDIIAEFEDREKKRV